MDIFDFDIVKVEKANALMRYRRLQHLTKLFRLGEVCLVLVFLCWISSRLPFIVKIAVEYFRLLLSIIITPLFIFLLCNVIVLTLLAKSGQLTGHSQTVDNADDTELYENLLTSTEQMISSGSGTSLPVTEPEAIIYQDKEMIYESETKITPKQNVNQAKLDAESVPDPKVFRRSQSEHLKPEFLEPEKHSRKLRRSETEVYRKIEIPAKALDVVDELSNEEFQRRIEGFIAKQVKFHQEEKLAIVLHTS